MSNVIPYYTSARNVNNSSANLNDYDAYVTDLFHGTIGNYVFGYSSTYNTIFRSDVSTDASITIVLEIEEDPDILLYVPLTEEIGVLFLDESSTTESILVYDVNWTDSTYIYRNRCDYASHFNGYGYYFNEVIGVTKNSDNLVAILSFEKYIPGGNGYIDFLLYDNTNNIFTFINGPMGANDDYYCGDYYPKYFSDLGNGICSVILDTDNYPEDPENLSDSYISILNTNSNTCNFIASPRLVDNPLSEGNYYYDLCYYYSIVPNYSENSFYFQSLYAQYTSGSWAYSTKILKIDTLGNIYPSRELTSGSSGDTSSFILSYSKNKIISSHYDSGSLIFYDVTNGSEISAPSYFNETTISQNLDDSTNEIVVLKYSEPASVTLQLVSEANMSDWAMNDDLKEGYENGWNWTKWVDYPQYFWTNGYTEITGSPVGIVMEGYTNNHRFTYSSLVDNGTIPFSNDVDNFIKLNNLTSGSYYMVTTDGLINNIKTDPLGTDNWFTNAFRVWQGDDDCTPFGCTTFGKSQEGGDFTAGSVAYSTNIHSPGYQAGDVSDDELHAEIYFLEGDLGTEINHVNADFRATYEFYEIFFPWHIVWENSGEIDYFVYNAINHLYETSICYPVNRYVRSKYYLTLRFRKILNTPTPFFRVYFSDGTYLESSTATYNKTTLLYTISMSVTQAFDGKLLTKVVVGQYYDTISTFNFDFIITSLTVDAMIVPAYSDKLLKIGSSGSTLLYDFDNKYLFRDVYFLKLSNSILLIPTIQGYNKDIVMHRDYYAATGNLFQIIWWSGG